MNLNLLVDLSYLFLRVARLILNVDSTLCNFSCHIPYNLIPSKYIFYQMVTCYISNVGPPRLSQPSPPAVLVTMSSTDIIERKMFRLEKVFLF